MTTAIIPRHRRISAIMPSAPGTNGYTFQLATAQDYRDYAREQPVDGKELLTSVSEQGIIGRHGIAVLMEIFDSVDVEVPFTGVSLVGELSTLETYAYHGQRCVISAVLRWAAAQETPQVRKIGGKWALQR